MTKNGAQKLMKDIGKKINKWNECSMFKLKDINNLSISDLDTLILYAETFLANGNVDSLMPLRGDIKKVWDQY